MKRFLISDTHFGHENIIKYENRPFRDAEHMTDEIIKRWNNKVSKTDVVYHLGDFSLGLSKIDTFDIIQKLNGKIVLILGNHDLNWINFYRDVALHGKILMASPCPIIVDDHFILSHAPVYLDANSVFANIYGHVHNDERYKTITKQTACVCNERWNYEPVEFDKVISLMHDFTDNNQSISDQG